MKVKPIYSSVHIPNLTFGHELWVMGPWVQAAEIRLPGSACDPHADPGSAAKTILYLSASLGTPQDPSGGLGGSGQGEKCQSLSAESASYLDKQWNKTKMYNERHTKQGAYN